MLTAPDGVDAWKGPYLDADVLPKDPWGHDFQYAYPPTHGTALTAPTWSLGPDGQDGTDNDVTSWTVTSGSGSSGSGSGGK